MNKIRSTGRFYLLENRKMMTIEILRAGREYDACAWYDLESGIYGQSRSLSVKKAVYIAIRRLKEMST
ncbi:hypothetical protein J2S09_002898 [Bacillus fengqiuensis]|nr:hypothetical protein [Bacillus fengqiuensis]